MIVGQMSDTCGVCHKPLAPRNTSGFCYLCHKADKSLRTCKCGCGRRLTRRNRSGYAVFCLRRITAGLLPDANGKVVPASQPRPLPSGP